MIFRLTLVGAHHAACLGHVEPERLDVELRIRPGGIRLAPFRAELAGTVRAEGLAESAEATGELRGGRGGIHYRLDFDADDARPMTLSLSQALAEITVRSLTELSGQLVARDTGTVFGRALLRFDVRRALTLPKEGAR